MKMREKVMLFCYMYIIGVALGFMFPLSQSANLYYGIATALLGLAWLAVVLLRRRGARLAIGYVHVLMCLFALVLGTLRYNQDFTIADDLLGTLNVGQQTVWAPVSADGLDELRRLRVQKLTAHERDVELQFTGKRNGRAVTARLAVPAADAVGTSYVVDEPFDELGKITAAGRTASPAEFAVYAVSNHLSSFASDNMQAPPYEVEGIIAIDPDLYADRARIQLDVISIRPVGADYAFPVSGGSLQATLRDRHPDYREITQLETYGWKIRLRGTVLAPAPLTNPGGFNFKRFLQNSGMYGTMNLYDTLRLEDGNELPTIDVVEKSDGTPIVEFSLHVKDRMLRVFKQTMPYPESAFLGGVTLGLRYGLQRAMTPFDGTHLTLPDWAKTVLPEGAQRVLTSGTNQTIPQEFQWAGINHVLAVSGLHVTIITIMFWGIFTMLRVPPKIYAPIIVLALLVFAVITGYRPSTQRAALMNSIAVIATTYMGKGLRAGILFTIPFSGFLVLIFQPLLIVEPSLTLSYFAVLSLGLLTTPCQRLLARLRGWTFVAFMGGIAVWTVLGCWHWHFVAHERFWMPFLVLFVLTVYAAHKLNARFPSFTFGYSDIPLWLSGFFAAQFGIQFGMMIPLSSFYFGRWPLAGAYANFIAIPLIGIIVQLAMIAGILSLLLPFWNIGTYLALLLNATNYFLAKLFVAVGHFSVLIFPYPQVAKWSPSMVFFYFMVIAAFIWHQAILVRLRGWALRARADAVFRAKFYALAGGLALAMLVWFGSFFVNTRSEFELTALSVRYGESILIEAPDRSDILINGGSHSKLGAGFDNGMRTVIPALSKKLIRTLDWMMATTVAPECFGGLNSVLQYTYVENLLLPFDPAKVTPATSYEDFLTAIGGAALRDRAGLAETETLYDEVVAGFPRLYVPGFVELLAQRGPTLPNRYANWHVRAQQGKGGMTPVDTVVDGHPYRIEVIAPNRFWEDNPVANNSLSLRVTYGNTAFLLPGDIGLEALDDLLQLPAAKLKADVLVFPHHGTLQLTDEQCDLLLTRTGAKHVIFSYQRDRNNPRPYDDYMKENWERCVAKLGFANCLRTDLHGAAIVTSDGERVQLDTMAWQENRSTMAVSDDMINAIDVAF